MVKDDVSSKVTAIIKTFERPHCVDMLIRSIKKYYPNLPIIVADDSKKANVRDDVEYHVLPADSGISKGRNFLVAQVKTPYVLLLDDDFCFIKETKLEKLLDVLENTNIDIVGGRYLEKKGVRNSQATFHLKDGVLHLSTEALGEEHGAVLYEMVNNFFLARTEVLQKYTWDEQLKVGEHEDFFYRHKGKMKVAMHPEVFIYHFNDRSVKKYIKYRKRDHSVFKPMFLKKHGLMEMKRERSLLQPVHTVKQYVSRETIKTYSLKMKE